MAVNPLRENLIEAGEDLLKKVDDLGLGLHAAAWVYFQGMNDWRFFLSTPLVDTMGQKKVYGLLADALEVIGTPEELTIFDLHLESPSGPLFSMLSQFFHVSNSRVTFNNCTINGTKLDAVMLRMVAPSTVPIKKTEVDFKRNVKKVLASVS